jgi:hypothetical protein
LFLKVVTADGEADIIMANNNIIIWAVAADMAVEVAAVMVEGVVVEVHLYIFSHTHIEQVAAVATEVVDVHDIRAYWPANH